MARLWIEQGRLDRARTLLGEALGRFEPTADLPEIATASALLTSLD